VKITFAAKDLPLAKKLINMFSGTLTDYKTYVVVTFAKIDSVILLTCLLNGHMRTPKIEALHRLIDFLNKKEQYFKKIPSDFLIENKLVKLGLDKSNLGTNCWLSGFLDQPYNLTGYRVFPRWSFLYFW